MSAITISLFMFSAHVQTNFRKNLLNNLITPAFGGRNNLPKFITPKVASIIADTQMRPQREGEITFSVDGSPVVKSNATASDKVRFILLGCLLNKYRYYF